MAVLLLILGLVLFVGLVVVHELGHFIVARRNGVEAEEFGIGFPPAFYKRRIKSKKGDYNLTLNLLPLGGFVKLKGEHDADTEPGTFGAASTWAKSKIMAAGVIMNLITAFILFTFIAIVGMPKLVDNQFTVASDTKVAASHLFAGQIAAGSPAAYAGLKSGDRLLKLTGPHSSTSLNGVSDLRTVTKQYAGQSVTLEYVRQDQHKQSQLKLRSQSSVDAAAKQGKQVGYLGVVGASYTMQRSTWSAPIVAGGVMAQFTALTFQGLGHALAGLGGIFAGAATGNAPARQNAQTEASSQVSGPLGIFFILKDGSLLGYEYVLFIIAIISLTLGIMNILPIPALDGGRLWLTLVSRAVGKPLSQRTEELVNASGFAVLMLLIIVITVVDVKRFL